MQISQFFLNGDIRGAIAYMREHQEFQDVLPAYIAIFENCEYRTYDVPDKLNDILRLYQVYYRDVFYCGLPEAEDKLLTALRTLLDMPDAEEALLADRLQAVFEAGGFHALFVRPVYLAGNGPHRLPDGAARRYGRVYRQYPERLCIPELDGLPDLRPVRYRRQGVAGRHHQLH